MLSCSLRASLQRFPTVRTLAPLSIFGVPYTPLSIFGVPYNRSCPDLCQYQGFAGVVRGRPSGKFKPPHPVPKNRNNRVKKKVRDANHPYFSRSRYEEEYDDDEGEGDLAEKLTADDFISGR